MNLKNIIQQLADKGLTNPAGVICTVDTVDVEKYQCDLTPVDGSAAIIGARLTAAESINNTLVLVPKAGSYVIVQQVNQTDAWVAMCAEVDDIIVSNHAKITVQNETDVEIINQGNVKIENGGDVEIIAGGQAVLKNAQTTLKTILNRLLGDLKTAVIQTPSGPGNFDPATVTKLTEIDGYVNQLFKE